MLRSNNQNTRRYTILISTTILIIFGMSFYYFYNGKVKQQKIRATAFKVLYRKANDIKQFEKEKINKEKINGERIYLHNEETRIQNKYQILIQEFEKIKQNLTAKISEQKTKKDASIISDTIFLKDLEGLKCLKDYLQYFIEHGFSKLEGFDCDSIIEKDDLQNDLQKDVERIGYIAYRLNELNSNSIIKNENESLHVDSLIVYKAERVFNDSNIKYPDSIKLSILKSDFDQLLKSIFFESVYLANDTGIIYPTSNLALKQSITNIKIDSLFTTASDKKGYSLSFGLDNSESDFAIKNNREKQQEIELFGEKYQVFMAPVQGVQIKYLVGLISNDKYNAKKKAINRVLVTAITIFVLLIIFSLPFIKLLVVTFGEKFTVKALVELVLSGLVILFIIGFCSVYYTSKFTYDSNISQTKGGHLDSISDVLQQNFKEEIGFIKSSLDSFCLDVDTLIKRDTSKIKKLKQIKQIKQSVDNIPKLNKSDYHTWKVAFVVNVDTQYMDSYNKTTFILRNGQRYGSYSYKPVGVDVTDRDYVKNPDKFYFDTDSVGLESIYSLSTVKPGLIMSKNDSVNKIIVCLSTEMYSVSKTILPQGYSFCVVDNSGKVWFHHEAENNLRENLLEETNNNPQLQAALKSGRKKVFISSYKLQNTIMHIKPLMSEFGLYLVIMCNPNDLHQIVNQAGYMLIAGMFVIFLIWIFLGIIYMWRNYLNRKSDVEPNCIVSFFPNKNFTYKYKKMMVFNAMIALLAVFSVILFNSIVYANHWFRLIFIIGAGVILWNIRVLRLPQLKKGKKTLVRDMLIQILFFIVAELFFYNKSNTYNFVSGFISLSIIVCFNVLLWYKQFFERLILFMAEKAKRILPIIKVSFLNIYNLYVASFTGGLVLVPILVLYIVLFQQERSLYLMHQQRYVAEKYMQKYNTIIKEGGNSLVREKLLKEGNYIGIIDSMSIESETIAVTSITKKKGELIKAANQNYLDVFGMARSYMFILNNTIEDRGNSAKPNYFDSEDGVYKYAIKGDKQELQVKKNGGIYNYPDSLYLKVDKAGIANIPNFFLGGIVAITLISIVLLLLLPIIGRYLFPTMRYLYEIFKNRSFNKSGRLQYVIGFEFQERILLEKQGCKVRTEKESTNKTWSYVNNTTELFLFIENIVFKNIEELEDLIAFMEKKISKNEISKVEIVNSKVPEAWINEIKSFLKHLYSDNKEYMLKGKGLLVRLEKLLFNFQIYYRPLENECLLEKDEKMVFVTGLLKKLLGHSEKYCTMNFN